MFISPIKNISFRNINYFELNNKTGENFLFGEKNKSDLYKKNTNLGKRYYDIIKQIKSCEEEIFGLGYVSCNMNKDDYEFCVKRLHFLENKIAELKKEKQKLDNIVPDLSFLPDNAEAFWIFDSDLVKFQ